MAKRKKISIPPLFIKFVFLAAICGGLIYMAVFQTTHFFKQSDYFKIKMIAIDPSLQFISQNDLAGLRGQNIFTVDLKRVQQKMLLKYPQVSYLKIVKQFPNQILVGARKRDPFVQMRAHNKILTLDDQGIVLSASRQSSHQFPLIVGADSNAQNLRFVGSVVRDEGVRAAINIIKSFRQNSALKGYAILEIEASNLSKIQVKLSNKIKIFLDQDKINERILILGIIFTQGQINIKDIDYVDLRFKEPVIGKKIK